MVCGRSCHNAIFIISGITFLFSACIATYNLIQMTSYKEMLIFEFTFQLSAKNFRLGIIVQSAMIAIISLIFSIHEFAAIGSHIFLPFLGNDMGRAIVHVILAVLSLGFCGGIGIYICLFQVLVAVICFVTATAEEWNPNEIESQGYFGSEM